MSIESLGTKIESLNNHIADKDTQIMVEVNKQVKMKS